MTMASSSSSSPPTSRSEKKKSKKQRWWLTRRKEADRHTREARALLATHQPHHVAAALALADAALLLCPRSDDALELKARCLLFLRRFRDVADLLRDYIPSSHSAPDDDATTATSLSSSATTTSSSSSSSSSSAADAGMGVPLCFSVSDIKRRLWSHGEREGQWRYIVLGQACYHLGLMEDALVLLQTGRRLAAASCRRESLDLHDDSFAGGGGPPPSPPAAAELDCAAALLAHVKQLLRRRAAAAAALEADLPVEAARHFSKILDARRGLPHVFAAGCLVGRAAAHRAAGRIAEAIADCNRALAVDPGSITALRARAEMLELVGAVPDCLRDLDHLKLLYDAVLWDRRLPGTPWRPHHGDVAGSLKAVTGRIQELRRKVAAGEVGRVDYHLLLGLERGCGRSELRRAHLLLSLRHRPEKAAAFVDRLELADEHRDGEAVRDQARTSAMVLYRMLQKGYSSVMADIAAAEEEDAARRRRERAEAEEAARAMAAKNLEVGTMRAVAPARKAVETAATAATAAAVFQGVFCRDLAAVSNLLSRVKLETMSC